jgi:hypothetical protein
MSMSDEHQQVAEVSMKHRQLNVALERAEFAV